MGYVKLLESHVFTVKNVKNSRKLSRNTRSALYFSKTMKKHTSGSGNSSPLFSGGVKHHFFGFPDIRSIIRGRLEGGSFKSVKSGQTVVKRCQNC